MSVTRDEPAAPHDAADPRGHTDGQIPAGLPDRPATDAVCPYLISASGGWRSIAPHREHRCAAVDPPAPLSAEKQRRLCLALAHQTCPTYGAARAARAAAIAPGVDPAVLAAIESSRRPVARSAPIILEQPRLGSTSIAWPLDRAVSQVALVGLMVVAFALVAIARLSATDAGTASTSPSPQASAAIVAGTPSPTPLPTPSPSPSIDLPSQSAAPPSAAPATPVPSFRTTYTVKSGDTLLGIASRFKTTVAKIKKLNNLTSNTLHIGQKLKIP
jgi:LysM repeat protein